MAAIFTVAHKCNTQIYFKIHKYISKHTNIFQNTQIYFKTHKYISKYTNIFQNTQYISKHTNIFQNTQIYFFLAVRNHILAFSAI